ncbi:MULTISPECIES: metalloregulator ArsR/SmtB family transcription factor [Alphaproteobacteria]|uniref:HTH arsR-type domain-containing protein n=2 Tax=Alphaproteobacteria TaxID=28211 RepID=A0A512HMW1_9HYPH|nr:metalloregulator ArsR/SmtB family transcription factor [Sphingomonas psychrolutea]GEO86781.1 hypothetical protein RNA01_37130 [Ciceribacter naphthalenivorans]GLR23361.1 hypothetical protein GCM10007920_31520 [Ciceribacter naphthalenivorans]GLT06217.1 hypothetical protein GCM10007926_31520 [Sphingomonas psychrolutea]
MKKQTKKKISGKDERRVQQVFQALSAPPRRAILKYLTASGLTAGEIASHFDMAKPSISQHLTILETAGLITREKRGQFVHYALARTTLMDILSGFIAEFSTAESAAQQQAKAKPDTPGSRLNPKPKAGPDETIASAEPEPEAKPTPAQMSMF